MIVDVTVVSSDTRTCNFSEALRLNKISEADWEFYGIRYGEVKRQRSASFTNVTTLS